MTWIERMLRCRAMFDGTDGQPHICTLGWHHFGRHYCDVCKVWEVDVR